MGKNKQQDYLARRVQLLTLLVMLNSVLKSWQVGRCTCSWFSMIVYVT